MKIKRLTKRKEKNSFQNDIKRWKAEFSDGKIRFLDKETACTGKCCPQGFLDLFFRIFNF